MKTHLTHKLIHIVIIAAIILISCSKKDDMMNPVVHPATPYTPTAIGAITDSGAVSPGVRVMKMDLNTQNFALYNSNEEVSFADAKVKVAFYVNSDGSIPPGSYSFSDSDSKTPFTFDSASLHFTPGVNTSNSQSDQVADGTITVNRDGDVYVFSMQLNLASGMKTSQTYGGVLDYADSN